MSLARRIIEALVPSEPRGRGGHITHVNPHTFMPHNEAELLQWLKSCVAEQLIWHLDEDPSECFGPENQDFAAHAAKVIEEAHKYLPQTNIINDRLWQLADEADWTGSSIRALQAGDDNN